MVICDKKIDMRPFAKLANGDVFINDSTYCLKIEEFYYAEDETYINFITLVDGLLGGYIKADEMVEKVKCELVVK